MELTDIRDYTDLTCTNLMLRLKIKLKQLEKGQQIGFYSTREQHDNIEKPFSKKPYVFNAEKKDDNCYLIQIARI